MSTKASQNRLGVALHKLRKSGLDALVEGGITGAAFRADTLIVWSARPFLKPNKRK